MTLEPGVSRALARERARRVSALRVSLGFCLPADRTLGIPATARIAFHLTDTSAPLALDFAPNSLGRIESCDVNGFPADPVIRNEHVELPARALRAGQNIVQLRFLAGDGPLNRRDDHLYTIFVPARAREAFPCFDQPDLKARWSLRLETPDHWVAVSNTDSVETGPAGDGRTAVTFAETAPLPTYLFAFAAGVFLEDIASVDGRELRIYHTAADVLALERNREALISGHGQALAWLERYTAIPYPFGKLDIVLLPAFQFGGMEHPGAIFYNAAGVLLSPSATRQQLLARANVIAHETAHMWFGDLVTMTWFDDVWMKEVFANFMAAKIVNPAFPDLDHDLRFLHAHYPAAYDVDRTAGANPIRQPLENLNDAGSLYGAIVYLKAPIVMRQLELLLGDDRLRDALREYLASFAFGNASWAQLLDILAAKSPIDLRSWTREWIDEPGRPLTRTTLTHEDGRVRVELRTPDPGGHPERVGPAWTLNYPQKLRVAFGLGERIAYADVWSEGNVVLPVPEHRDAPDFVLPNGGGLGYGEFHLDAGSRTWLMVHLPEVRDALTRGSAWLTLWDAMLVRELEPEPLLDLAMRAVPLETSELNLQRVLHYIERLFWIFVPPGDRLAVTPRVEAVLRASLEASSLASTKAALFGTLRSVATSSPTIEWLRSLWSGQSAINGLPLDDIDRIALALELAVRGADDGDLIAQQIERSQPGERRDALAFIAPSVSSSEGERDRFFELISDSRNRRKEPWVIEGLRWLNHPLRTAGAVKYVRPGLERLEDVKRTGDIFMPKRWLESLLSGHRSVEAALAVDEFLDRQGSAYPAALRRMILASADQLMRVRHLR